MVDRKVTGVRHYLFLVLVVLLALVGAACVQSEPVGTSQSETDSRTTSAPAAREPTAVPATPGPKLPGFDFQVGEGTFWEYEWESQSGTFCRDCRGGPTINSGTFRVTLGPPKEIEGITAYEIQVMGESGGFAPRWSYLAVADNLILVSNDGFSFIVLFDGQEGKWPGSGFFTTNFKSKDLYEGTLAGRNVVVSASSRSGGCVYYRSVGKVCPGGEAIDFTATETYRQGVGPVAYSYRYSYSTGTGSTYLSLSKTQTVSLVGSSLP